MAVQPYYTPPASGVNDPPYMNGSNNTGRGSSTGSGTSNSYIGSYTNLPSGVSNAGNGGNNAYVGEVTPDGLVENRLTGLLASNSPYIAQARLAGMNTANDRGLLNSGMAAGNAEQQAIQAGLPIAQQDANSVNSMEITNLNNLNQVLATAMNNRASEYGANAAAGATRYAADLGLTNNRENRTFEGQQAGINRNFQDYMTQMGYGNQMRMEGMQIGGSLLQGSQNFNNNLMLQASQNPFMLNDPQSLQGFMDFANGDYNDYANTLFGYGLNGGNNLPQWQENDNWYTSPDYSQQYGDGTYVGGGPQLPYQYEPPNSYSQWYG